MPATTRVWRNGIATFGCLEYFQPKHGRLHAEDEVPELRSLLTVAMLALLATVSCSWFEPMALGQGVALRAIWVLAHFW